MAITPFHQPIAAEFIDTYVPFPAELAERAMAKKSAIADAVNQGLYDMASELSITDALDQISLIGHVDDEGRPLVLDVGDRELVESVKQSYDEELQNLAEDMQYYDSVDPMFYNKFRSLATRYGTEKTKGVLARAAANKAAYEKIQESARKEGWDKYEAAAINAALQQYAQSDRSEDFLPYLQPDFAARTEPDISDRLDKLEPGSHEYTTESEIEDNVWMTQSGRGTRAGAGQSVFFGDPGIKEWMNYLKENMWYDVNLYGKDPEVAEKEYKDAVNKAYTGWLMRQDTEYLETYSTDYQGKKWDEENAPLEFGSYSQAVKQEIKEILNKTGLDISSGVKIRVKKIIKNETLKVTEDGDIRPYKFPGSKYLNKWSKNFSKRSSTAISWRGIPEVENFMQERYESLNSFEADAQNFLTKLQTDNVFAESAGGTKEEWRRRIQDGEITEKDVAASFGYEGIVTAYDEIEKVENRIKQIPEIKELYDKGQLDIRKTIGAIQSAADDMSTHINTAYTIQGPKSEDFIEKVNTNIFGEWEYDKSTEEWLQKRVGDISNRHVTVIIPDSGGSNRGQLYRGTWDEIADKYIGSGKELRASMASANLNKINNFIGEDAGSWMGTIIDKGGDPMTIMVENDEQVEESLKELNDMSNSALDYFLKGGKNKVSRKLNTGHTIEFNGDINIVNGEYARPSISFTLKDPKGKPITKDANINALGKVVLEELAKSSPVFK